MGFLSRLKERAQATQAFDRPSTANKIGVDVVRQTKAEAHKDNLFESKEEKRARNKATAARYVGHIKTGMDKFEKGKKQAGKFLDGLGDLIPNEAPSKGRKSARRSSSSDNDFFNTFGGSRSKGSGFSDKDIMEMSGLSGFGQSTTRRRATRHKTKHKAKRRHATRAKASNPFDIDLGF